jgi:hypothetical protein
MTQIITSSPKLVPFNDSIRLKENLNPVFLNPANNYQASGPDAYYIDYSPLYSLKSSNYWFFFQETIFDIRIMIALSDYLDLSDLKPFHAFKNNSSINYPLTYHLVSLLLKIELSGGNFVDEIFKSGYPIKRNQEIDILELIQHVKDL